MAIYHFSGTVISRSQGRSAVACAAYRSAEKLQDERYGKEHDYTKKTDVVYSDILLPDVAPAWMGNREALWNAVEAHEKRKDAQLAREFNFALPRELSVEQNVFLAREFVEANFVKQGMVADICIHNDHGVGGERQPHVHVMLTMREVSEAGFGQKVRAWNDKGLLMGWREAWAETANCHLALHGHDLSIDHRTLEAQQIELEPQYKIGASVARDKLVRLEDHQRIARENGEKLLSNPTIALSAMTRQQSTFTHQDLARFVNRHTVDADQFLVVYEKIKGCEAMVFLGLDAQKRERFTTHEMLFLESRMIEKAMVLLRTPSHAVGGVGEIEIVEKTEKAVEEREIREIKKTGNILSLEQQKAFDHVVSAGGLKCLVGYAGTGKSHLLGTARDVWEKDGFNVSGVTLSGIAAQNLQGGSGIVSRTLASRCYYWDKGEERLSHKDVLVVDEAGMLSSRQMGRLIDEAHRSGAKVVLVGDPQQLQAIEAGAAFRAIAERVPLVELTEIRRQRVSWQRDATKELARGATAAALDRYKTHSNIHAFDTTGFAKAALIENWNDARLLNPLQSQIMLAYQRCDVLELNELARHVRMTQGELGEDHVFQTERGARSFAKGDRLYFLKNDRTLGVMNGTLGTVDRIEKGVLTILVDAPSTFSKKEAKTLHPLHRVAITMERYPHLDYGYAATIHKAQGVTVDRSYVLGSRFLDAHSGYVALSRHRESVDIFYGRDVFLSEKEMVRTLGRERAKDVTLDYGQVRDIHDVTEKEIRKEMKLEHQDSLAIVSDKKLLRENKRDVRLDERLLRQEKLRQFTEKTLTASLSDHRQRTKEIKEKKERGDVYGMKNFKQDFTDFKRQFEAENPQKAHALRQAILPLQERQNAKVLTRVAEYERLSNCIAQGGNTGMLAKEELQILSHTMLREKDVMHYVHEKHPDMANDILREAKHQKIENTLNIQEIQKTQPMKNTQKILQREKSLDREIEF